MRDEFEKLPEIADRLHTVVYSEGINQYHAAIISSGLSVKYIQGAWYTFQEQQKKIDEIKAIAERWINEGYTYNSGSTDIKVQQMKDCGRDIIQKINGD